MRGLDQLIQSETGIDVHIAEDTKAGMIQAYLDKYTGETVCSKQLYKEALNLSLIHICQFFQTAALEIFDRFQIFFQFIGNSGLGRTLTILFMGFPNIPDNQV